MRKQKEILFYIRDLILRKSLYYSILYLILSLIIGISTIIYNYFFIPELTTIKVVVKGIGLVWLIAVILGPLRLLILFILSWILPERFFYFILRKYDDGRLNQTRVLENNRKALDTWASQKIRDRVTHDLKSIKNQWRKQFYPTVGIITGFGLIISLVFIPTKIKESSYDELVKGSYSSARPSLPPIPDTLIYNYGDNFELGSYSNCIGRVTETIKSNSFLDRDLIVNWYNKGRFIKTQYIQVDSIPKIHSVECVVTPPSYLKLLPYSNDDTIYVYKNSLITFNCTGLLLDKVSCLVSRETISIESDIVWRGENSIALVDDKDRVLFKPTIIELKDNAPAIKITENTSDSLWLLITDDFGLNELSINELSKNIQGTSIELSLAWGQSDAYTIKVRDVVNQNTNRVIRRPEESKDDLLTRLSMDASNKLGLKEDQQKTIVEYSREAKKSETISQSKEEKDESNTEIKKENEKYEAWMKELNMLWNEELLVSLLNEVDTLANQSLDSAIQSVVQELLDSEVAEEKRAIIKKLDALPKDGNEREEQAKEAVKKLSELLNDDIASIQESNVQRIKNLLKSSWLTSLLQEDLRNITLAVNKASVQKNLFAIEEHIQDSLSYLLVHEQALGMALSEVSNNLSNDMRSLINAYYGSGNIDALFGYVLYDLNELSRILYDILESEKQALNTAKKNCKNGKPGKTGKPSSAGQGKPGPKGMPNEGKQPGGRKKGKNGETREEGKDGESGSSGKGLPKESELLKQIEALSDKALKEGKNELLMELLRLKEDLLFKGGSKDERIEQIEEKLWLVNNSVFSKEEQGAERSAEEGQLLQEKELEFEIMPSSKSGTSDLPLPILKRK